MRSVRVCSSLIDYRLMGERQRYLAARCGELAQWHSLACRSAVMSLCLRPVILPIEEAQDKTLGMLIY